MNQLTLSRSQAKTLGDILTYVLVIVSSAVIMVPVLWMLSTALKPGGEVFLFPPRWLPSRIEWHNFRDALTFLPFAMYFRNTSVITISAMLGQLLASPIVAYAFARLKARASNAIFVLVLATMMLPTHVTMIPLFILFQRLGWIDTFLPLIVPNFFGSAYYIFLLRQFFLTIPADLADAAKIDGCGHFGTYSRIYLPLSMPALATVAIFTFMFNWNDFMSPLIYLSSNRNWTLTLGLSRFTGMYGMTAWNLLMAATLVTITPCVLLFFFAQRYFIQGIVITGVKG
jgi:ABC-type glycerol-3-phosphate transport system permease component